MTEQLNGWASVERSASSRGKVESSASWCAFLSGFSHCVVEHAIYAMTEPFERELAVFSAVRRLPAAERAAYLDHTCAGDAALRRRVEELLRASEDAEGFLLKSAPGAQRPDSASAAPTVVPNLATPGEKAGDRIGRYKLLQQIGEGGCGLIYMAEQEEPVRRRVALKVIKLGMDTRQVIARFEAERQALALMDHPHIARVFDAGATETGRPYFVMELVKGIKITDYCDEHHLPTKDRLQLFIQVCHAVQHAHQKGIIHRDLKPSNILVVSDDGVPVPKVIDFGIAKATQGRLTDQTLFTAFEQFIGTPAYMSPEQAELTMQDVDTRTDIYSLGVLLYELLIGRTPFDTQELLALGLDVMRRTIREREPQRPSTKLSTMLQDELTTTAKHRHTESAKLIHSLRGDLDWIVMKCLEKDRARRYETASGLANDIRRYMNCEPVVARPPSRLYEFQKTVRRHKFGFATAAALITVLSAGVVVSTWQAMRVAGAQRATTEKLFDSYLAQARARRRDEREGRRFESLEAAAKAAAIHSSLELRNEAIACLALTDLRFSQSLKPMDPDMELWSLNLERRAVPRPGGSVSVRRTDDNGEVASLPSQGAEVFTLSGFSPDGRYLVVRYMNRRNVLWDVERKEPAITNIPNLNCADFSTDGRTMFASCSDGLLHRFDLDPIREGASIAANSNYYAIRLRPQNDRFAGFQGDNTELELCDLPDGAPARKLHHPSYIQNVAWSADGLHFAVGCWDGQIFIYDALTGEKEKEFQGHADVVTSVGFSHSGWQLASSCWDGEFQLWDLASGKALVTASGWSYQAIFSTDDRRIGYVHRASESGALEVTPSSILRWLNCKRSLVRGTFSTDISTDGRLVAAALDDGVHFWIDGQTEEPFHLPFPGCCSVIFTPDGTNVITCGRSGIARWPMRRVPGVQRDEIQLGPPQTIGTGGDFNFGALSKDGNWLAAANTSASAVSVFEVRNPTNHFDFGSQPRVQFPAISPDGRWVAVGNFKTSGVKVWDFESKQAQTEATQTLPTPSTAWVSFSPDSRWLGVSADNFDLWETGSWKHKYTFSRDRPDMSAAIAFSPDSRILAIGDEPGVIHLVAADSGDLLANLEAPFRIPLTSLRFSADGSQLFALQLDKQIQVWDLRKLRAELGKLNLDWSAPPIPPESPGPKPPRKRLHISLVESVSPLSGGTP
jgi:serine/threonine protein kinase/WD40 repeat protein